VQRALYVYQFPELLTAMRRHAMASPLFWEHSVKPYDQMYRSLLGEPDMCEFEVATIEGDN
jgi:starch synthase